ncbi:MAG: SDR family oxidoreductase [Planctomycetota bacterium]|nr:SDR family oxidoreductase [Planctomycetota bacterium]
MKLKGKTALVTGASSGIGRATAIHLAKEGANVAITARRVERLEELKGELEQHGVKCIAVKGDVTVKEDCYNVVKTIMDEWGKLDILVNNAGVMPLSYVDKVKVDQWEKMVDVNVKGVLFMTAAALPHMTEAKGGHIVNVSSVAGRRVFKGGAVYCATKFAVTAFSEGLRQELAPQYGIRVTSIEPGAVDTELGHDITDEDIIENFMDSMEKMKKLESDDIAAGITYAVTQPQHVDVDEIEIRPTQQPL